MRAAGPSDDPAPPQKELAVRWGVGCLVAGVALIGVAILFGLLVYYVQAPTWIQIAVGVLLALGAVALAWVVATAVGQSDPRRGTGRKGRPPAG